MQFSQLNLAVVQKIDSQMIPLVHPILLVTDSKDRLLFQFTLKVKGSTSFALKFGKFVTLRSPLPL